MNTKLKRLSSLLLAAALCLTLCGTAFADGDVINIKTADDLIRLSENCKLDTWSQGKSVELDADISLDSAEFTPIPSFGGTFNGNGRTISGLNISGKYSSAGLFAAVQEGGTVKNLNVSGSVDTSGASDAAGGIAGTNSGKIIACSFSGSVSGSVNTGAVVGRNELTGTVQNCRSTGAVYGDKMTGGIAGCNLGLLSSCTNTAYVNTVSSDRTVSIQDISLDLSFDLSKLASRDTVTSTFDTGGIAGYSSGIIRSCSNEAVVGYRHVGYNVGGISGRSCGFISGCTNSGTVYGRKDVGGITGQMEPYMKLNVENSMLARMQQQLSELSALIDQAANDVQGGAGGVSSRLNSIAGSVGGALDEIGNINVSIGGSGQIDGSTDGNVDTDITVDVPPLDVDISTGGSSSGSVSGGFEIVATPDLGGLSAAISAIGSQLSMLNGAIAGSVGAFANDIRAINEKFSELSNTMFDAIFSAGSSDGDILSDTSALDIELVRLGKICASINTGSVSGDLNIGGVAGAMAIEYELDPEDDVSTNISAEYKKEYELKAVLQNCTNRGSVDALRSCAGSVAGRMDLGIITGCRGFGDVASESGDYVGGIVGLTSATVRSNWAKCTLSGGKYVGGIVGSGVTETVTGSGSTVAGCFSMVDISSAEQYTGAVSGANAGEYLENYFVSDDLPGIDGVSISGKAEPVSYAAMLELPGLPSEMRTLTLSFIADDRTLKSVPFNYGDSFGADVFPDIPEKEGYCAAWDKTTLDNLHFDTVVTAEYSRELTAAASGDTRDDGRSVFFVEGKYGAGASVASTSSGGGENLAPLGSELTQSLDSSAAPLPWYARLTAPVSGGMLEQRHVSLPDDGQQTHTLHYLPPQVSIGELAVYVMQDGRWVKADTEQFGSYLVFDVTGTEADIAAVSVINVRWLWAALALLLAVIVLITVLSVKRRRRGHKSGGPKQENNGSELPALPEDRTEDKPAEKPGKRKKRSGKILLIIAVLLVLAAAAAILLAPRFSDKLTAYRALTALDRAPELTMQVSVDAGLGGEQTSAVIPVSIKDDGGTRYTRVQIGDAPLYYSGGMLILENGRAYSLGNVLPNYPELLPTILSLYRETALSGTADGLQFNLDGQHAEELLRVLSPGIMERVASVSSASVGLSVSGGAVQRIDISASGSLSDNTSSAFSISAAIDGFTYSADFDVPEKVAGAAAGNNAAELPEITDGLFRIITAWAELDSRESTSAELTLSADCGPVVVDSSIDLSSWLTDGERIYCARKGGLSLYFNSVKTVKKDGTAVSSADSSLIDAAKLADAAYLACLNGSISTSQNGSISTSQNGSSYICKLSLDGDSIAQIVQLIAPDVAKLDANFSYGTLEITISDEKISEICISCTGTMKVVLVETPISAAADIKYTDEPPATIPAKVHAALK